MKLKTFLLTILLVTTLIGCSQNSTSDVSIQDENGQVLVEGTDFKRASLDSQEDQLAITVTFDDKNKIKEITENSLNEIVFIYLGEELVASPRIEMVIESDSIQFSGDYSEEKATQFINAVNN